MTEDQKQALIEVQRYSVCEGWIVADEVGRFVTYEAFRSLEQRAEAAEAKLAELEKQEAVAFVNAPRKAKMLYAGERLPVDTNLYARPAPAVSLAELVPDKKSTDIDYAYYPLTKARHEGYNECVDDILRNIEESGKKHE